MKTEELIRNLRKTSTSRREGELLDALLAFYSSNETQTKTFNSSISSIEKTTKSMGIKQTTQQNAISNIQDAIANDVETIDVPYDDDTNITISHKDTFINTYLAGTEEGGYIEYYVNVYLPSTASAGDKLNFVFSVKDDGKGGTQDAALIKIHWSDTEVETLSRNNSSYMVVYDGTEWQLLSRQLIS